MNRAIGMLLLRWLRLQYHRPRLASTIRCALWIVLFGVPIAALLMLHRR